MGKKKGKRTACEEKRGCPFVVSPESWRVRKLGSLFVFPWLGSEKEKKRESEFGSKKGKGKKQTGVKRGNTS